MLEEGRVLLPTDYEVDRAPRPAVASAWAVHWAVNIELSVLASGRAGCTGSTSTGITVWSSVGRARVWTLKTNRAVYAMGVETPDSMYFTL